MKLKSRFLVLLLAVVFTFTMFAMAACGDEDEGEKVSISLSQTSLTLVERGQNATINATVKGTNEAVKWTVDNDAVVNIQYEKKTCLIKPVGEGTAVVTATVGGKTAKCNVKVNPAPKPAVTITLSETELNLTRGEAATEVTATLTNAEEDDAVTWSLAEGGDAFVTITPDGNTVSVLPIAVGTTTLTATLGDVTEDVAITVAKALVTLELDKTKVELKKGEEGEDGVKLTETVTATATNNEEKVQWKVGNTKIATIEADEDGNTCTVTAVAVGTTTLTATVEGVTKTIGIEVDGEAGEVEIILSEEEDIELTAGATKNISVTVVGTLAAPAWSVDNEEVIEIVGEGSEITVKALKEGTVTLTVKVGEETKTLNISVWDAASLEVDLTEVVLVNEEGDDRTAEVTATVTGKIKTASWEITAGEEYIELSGEGNARTITAKAAGTATIEVTVGDLHETITVTVKAPVSLEIDNEELSLKVGGGNGTITATVGGTEDEIEYEIVGDDKDCITVEQNGNTLTVIPVETGTATIKVTVGNKTAECAVNVEGMPKLEFNSTTTFGEAGGFIWHQGFFTANETVTSESTMEVVVKVNGSVVTPNETKLLDDQVQVQIAGSKYDDVEISFTFKNDGETVSTAKLTYKGEKEIVLDVELITIKVEETGTVSVTAVNGNIADKTVTWSIEDVEGENVATLPETVTGNSIVITAVNVGKARLTATVGEGENAITKTCEVTVSEGDVEPPEDVDVTAGVTKSFVYNDIFLQVEWTLTGIDGFNVADVKSYEVSAVKNDQEYNVNVQNRMGTSDTNVVGTGVQINIFSAPSGSTLTITINFLDGAKNVIGHATVNVDPPKSLTLSPTSLTFNLIEVEGADSTAVGVETQTVTATLGGPVTGTIEWTITNDDEDSDEDIATIVVSEDGKSVTVTAVAKGAATITATVDGLTKTCKVKVVDPKDGGGGGDDDTITITATEVRKDGAVYLIANMGKHFDFSYIKTGTSVGNTAKNTGNNRWDGASNFLIFAADANFTPTTSGETYIVEFYDENDTLLERAEVVCP